MWLVHFSFYLAQSLKIVALSKWKVGVAYRFLGWPNKKISPRSFTWLLDRPDDAGLVVNHVLFEGGLGLFSFHLYEIVLLSSSELVIGVTHLYIAWIQLDLRLYDFFTLRLARSHKNYLLWLFRGCRTGGWRNHGHVALAAFLCVLSVGSKVGFWRPIIILALVPFEFLVV